MINKKKRTVAGIGIFAILALLAGAIYFGGNNLSKPERAVLDSILNTAGDKEIEILKIPREQQEKFPALEKFFKVLVGGKEYYGILVTPHGYRSPINMMVVIETEKNTVLGIKIIKQEETPEFGGWVTQAWFSERFKGKSVNQYLKRAVLEVKAPNEIIQITSASITSQAVLNGVNAAMGIYREMVLGQAAEPVPQIVEGYITESK